MIKNSIFLIPFLLLLTANPAFPQPVLANGYTIQHFTDDNGLPQNSINDLLFDKNGFLWLASQVGLVRFHGTAFNLYYPDDKTEMESNILYLATNDEGGIFFQTDDHSLYHYDGNNSHFVKAVNTAALRRPSLINTRRQLFDFSHFLGNARGPETDRRRTIFRHLFDHNEDFFVAGTGTVYLIYQDSLFFYDGNDLRLLAGPTGAATRYLLIDN